MQIWHCFLISTKLLRLLLTAVSEGFLIASYWAGIRNWIGPTRKETHNGSDWGRTGPASFLESDSLEVRIFSNV